MALTKSQNQEIMELFKSVFMNDAQYMRENGFSIAEKRTPEGLNTYKKLEDNSVLGKIEIINPKKQKPVAIFNLLFADNTYARVTQFEDRLEIVLEGKDGAFYDIDGLSSKLPSKTFSVTSKNLDKALTTAGFDFQPESAPASE